MKYFMKAYKSFPEAGSDSFIPYALYFSVCGVYMAICKYFNFNSRSLFFNAERNVANFGI
jgi:hypothetical protein